MQKMTTESNNLKSKCSSIDLSKHVGSIFTTQPVFGYPLISFDDESNEGANSKPK